MANRGGVATEDLVQSPSGHNANGTLGGGDCRAVVAAVHDPCQRAANGLALEVCNALPQAQTCHNTDGLVVVVGQGLAAASSQQVLSQNNSLAGSVLSVGNAEAAHAAAGEVRNSCVVACSPCALDHAVVAGDAQVCAHANAATLVDREVGVLQHRGCCHTCGPNQGVGLDLACGGLVSHVDQLQVAVGCVGEGGVQQDLDAACTQLCNNLLCTVCGDLGHDARCSLDHDEVQVGNGETLVALHSNACHVLELGDGLNASEATTNDDEGQGAAACLSVGQHGCNLDAVQNPVTNGDCLFNGLQTDSNLCQTRNRECTGHCACTEYDLVVLQLEGLTVVGGLNNSSAVCVVDGDNAAGDQLGVAQVLAQRHSCVTAFHGTCCNLGEEGLVSHVGVRLNDGDDATGLLDSLLDLLSNGEANVAATDDQDARTVLCHLSECHFLTS